MVSIFATYYPGLNVALIFSFLVTVVLAVLVVPFAKRRPKGTPLSWGEAMLAAIYVFFVFFLAFGIVPHQWLFHADNELAWRKDKIVYGPFDILKPQSLGGPLPFTITYEVVRDVIVVGIYVFFVALMLILWAWWQKRGTEPTAKAALPTSTYGRPLVKKG